MIIPTNQMVITQDTVLSPGVYCLPDGIKIEGRDITLDGNGATLFGKDSRGSGIYAQHAENITIKNISLQNYSWGINIRDSAHITITHCNVRCTHEIPANTVFLDIWIPYENAYGAGIILKDVEHVLVEENDFSHQMNGLLTYHCNQLRVVNNLANYCSGWGFHLNSTSNSYFEKNSADYCCRYEPRDSRKGHIGADSAGFLIVNHSCDNKFIKNNARMGGDGFFLAGMNPSFEAVGCDGNLFEENDASYSPNNAFEATFSRGNIFHANDASNSNYGFWLGFSSSTVLEQNQMIANRQAGIAVENGVNFIVSGNLLSNNHYGRLLWSKLVPQIARLLPENITSLNWRIEHNSFLSNHKAIRIAANQDHGIHPLPESGELGLLAPTPAHHIIHDNKFESNVYVIEQADVQDTLIDGNEMVNNLHER